MTSQVFRKSALDRLSSPEQLDQMIRVTRPEGWLALVAAGACVLAALAWAFLGAIPERVHGEGVVGRDGRAFVYLRPVDGARVQPGMVVELVPDAVQPEEYGWLRGEVLRVSEAAPSLDALRARLGSDERVRAVTSPDAPLEVEVQLLAAATPSGFAWSYGHGPDFRIAAGTGVRGAVTVRTRRPWRLLMPKSRG